MGHTLRALVAETPLIKRICAEHPNCSMVTLEVGHLSMIPLSTKLEAAYNPAYNEQNFFWQQLLPAWARDWSMTFSNFDTIAFIATAIDVDGGGQAACVWKSGRVIYGPVQDIQFDNEEEEQSWTELPTYEKNKHHYSGMPFRWWNVHTEKRYVNAALGYLGVDGPLCGPKDAFEQAGLGLFRSTDDWRYAAQIENLWDLPRGEPYRLVCELQDAEQSRDES